MLVGGGLGMVIVSFMWYGVWYRLWVGRCGVYLGKRMNGIYGKYVPREAKGQGSEWRGYSIPLKT